MFLVKFFWVCGEKYKFVIAFIYKILGSGLVKKIINTILKQNTTLFGINPKVEKINVGFTNTIYNIDDSFICKICIAMKCIHSNVGESYDWTKRIKEQFISLYKKAKQLNVFSEEEQKLLDYTYTKFGNFLESNDFVLIHNDLHFDNIFFNDGKIKLIDFERSMYAPRDFELDILYRMIRKPWKFASEETEPYTDLSDYSNIMSYIEKYYPELVNIQNLYKRLAIYDIVYYLEHLIRHPDIEELKNDVLFATKKVSLKDEIN